MQTEFSERNATISPDGQWLAYESNASGQYEVWVRPFPNVVDGQWVISSGGGRWPLWNPDGGEELFYVGTQGVMAVAVATEPTFAHETPELLFNAAGYGTPDIVGDNRRMDVSPDGNRVLMFKQDALLDVPSPILIQNWTDELQRLVPVP